MMNKTLRDLVNELFGEYREIGEITDAGGLLTRLNDHYRTNSEYRTGHPSLMLQPVPVRK